jgi:molybdopterin-guanine dinucleotide biosynthesis protein A
MSSAAILLGGKAARFDGRDKSALIVNGRRIIDRQIDELSRVSDDILIVGAHGTPRRPSPEVGNVRSVADRVSGAGPLGGLDAALAAARDPVVLIVACDMPFVTWPLLGYLSSLSGEADAVVPRTKRGYHPLCAAYTRGCQRAIERRLAARQLAMAGLLDELRLRVVETDELERFGDPERLLANINTPGEYAVVEAHEGHKV